MIGVGCRGLGGAPGVSVGVKGRGKWIVWGVERVALRIICPHPHRTEGNGWIVWIVGSVSASG